MCLKIKDCRIYSFSAGSFDYPSTWGVFNDSAPASKQRQMSPKIGPGFYPQWRQFFCCIYCVLVMYVRQCFQLCTGKTRLRKLCGTVVYQLMNTYIMSFWNPRTAAPYLPSESDVLLMIYPKKYPPVAEAMFTWASNVNPTKRIWWVKSCKESKGVFWQEMFFDTFSISQWMIAFRQSPGWLSKIARPSSHVSTLAKHVSPVQLPRSTNWDPPLILKP